MSLRLLEVALRSLTVAALSGTLLIAQDSDVGVAMPFSFSAGLLNSHRLKSDDASASPFAASFRAVFKPNAQFGEHWFFYSAIQVSSTPYFYYDAYDSQRALEVQLLQGFLGYKRQVGQATLLVKAGRLSSAFGSFPLRYDDTDNPLLDQPLSYSYPVQIRADQLPCNIDNLIEQREYRYPGFDCGGATSEGNGVVPVTLYGLPGVEIDAAYRRVDARLQITNSSPSNPQNILSRSQHAQWTAGAGYTLRQGFRIGVSGFRGAWLDHAVSSFLPAAHHIGDYAASGLGIDAQWNRGRWSTSAEWQRFQFDYPGFRTAPATTFGYVEAKAVVNPRLYLAARAGFQRYNHPADTLERASVSFLPAREVWELAAGYRFNRIQLLKFGYEWLQTGTRDNVIGIQFVTSIDSLSKAFR
jgi:hypothetical protein